MAPIIPRRRRDARPGPCPGGGDRYHRRSMAIERVGVVGCGLMGSGIAEVCARAGLDVMVMEYDEAAAERGAARIAKSLDTAVRRNKLTEEDRDNTFGRIGFTTTAKELTDRQLVIEAVNEDE